ncbi:MAG TPA: cobalt transporter, partial [Sneathiellales bacterium]|nr:cobalt transporter [Sneathiellales bacterium]
MFVRIILTALIAGALAGAFSFAAHMAKTSPLIIHAEIYENAGSNHSHDATASAKGNVSESEEWAPADGIERGAYRGDRW